MPNPSNKYSKKKLDPATWKTDKDKLKLKLRKQKKNTTKRKRIDIELLNDF